MPVTLMNSGVCELSTEQDALAKERRLFGPPGTGKTTTMSRLIVEACQQFGSEGVLVCSFTKTAARELVSRNLPLDQKRVGTFHSICYRLLGNPTLLTGKASLEGWNQAHPVYFMSGGAGQAALDDPYAMDLMNEKGEGEGDQLLNELNRLRGLMVPRESWPESVQLFESCWSAYKDNTFTVDFTDLIDHCLKQQIPVMEGTRALFLDEVQDFSPLELSLARYWGSQCDVLYMAGDDDQCLYKFKGATPDAFLFPILPADQITVLDQSYRVPKAVHRLATTISGYIRKRQEKIYKPRDYEGLVEELPDVSYTYVDPLRDHLTTWVKAGKTVAILASCAYMLGKTKELLRDMGLPFHNPYKLHRGDWNPLTSREGTVSAARRVLAFLKPSRGRGMWTYPELWMWASELDAKSIFAHGAKTAIRRAAENEEWAQSPVLTSHLQEWISDPAAPEAILRGDMDWLQPRLLEKSQRSVGYACKIVKAHGAEALEKPPQIIIGTIHSLKGGEADCSPGEELVLTTKRGLVPIGDLDQSRDRLVSFNSDHHKIHRGGPCRPDGYSFTKGCRPYSGDLLTIETDYSRTQVTPNHHLTVRWSAKALGAFVVYLMKRGAWWRVGMTQLHYAERGQSGVLGRMRREGATDAWVLGVFETLKEALYHELLWSQTYRIPDLNFELQARNLNQISSLELHDIWNRLDSQTGALKLLHDFKMHPQWPLWSFSGEGRRIRQTGIRNRWTVRAVNLIPGYMEIPTDPGKGQEPAWKDFQVSRSQFSGEVFSLDVERWHHYVSGGAVVHNCVVLFPDLSRAGYDEFSSEDDQDAVDSVWRMMYVGVTRAKEELYVTDPASMMAVPVIA